MRNSPLFKDLAAAATAATIATGCNGRSTLDFDAGPEPDRFDAAPQIVNAAQAINTLCSKVFTNLGRNVPVLKLEQPGKDPIFIQMCPIQPISAHCYPATDKFGQKQTDCKFDFPVSRDGQQTYAIAYGDIGNQIDQQLIFKPFTQEVASVGINMTNPPTINLNGITFDLSNAKIVNLYQMEKRGQGGGGWYVPPSPTGRDAGTSSPGPDASNGPVGSCCDNPPCPIDRIQEDQMNRLSVTNK